MASASDVASASGSADEGPCGWWKPAQSTKWHYFVNGRSLCRRWGKLTNGNLDDSGDESLENCLECRMKKTKMKLREKGW